MTPAFSCRWCGSSPARHYLTGWCCTNHTPARQNGRNNPPTPDPALTLDGLRKAAGITWTFRATDTALNDDRAVASGRRRSTPQQYRAARAAEQARKSKP